MKKLNQYINEKLLISSKSKIVKSVNFKIIKNKTCRELVEEYYPYFFKIFDALGNKYIDMIPVEEDVYSRYKQFSETLTRLVKPGKTIGMVAEEMRKEWGDTYWYYFFFGRQYSNIVDRKDNEIAS